MLAPLSSANAARFEREVVVEVTSAVEMTGDMSHDQAVALALKFARVKAVEQVSGVVVASSTLIQNAVSKGSIVHAMSRGWVVAEDIVGWDAQWRPATQRILPPTPALAVTLRAKVGVPADSLTVPNLFQAKLNRNAFRDGEKLELKVSASRDIYLIVANYSANAKIIPLLPDRKVSGNLVSGNTDVTYPRGGDVDWIVHVAKGHRRDTEALLVYAIPKNALPANIDWRAVFRIDSEYEYAEFNQRLFSLPFSSMGMQVLSYTIDPN